MMFLCIYFVIQKLLASGKTDGSARGSVPWQGVIHVLMGVVWHWVGGRTYSRSLSCSQTTGACMMVRLCLKLAGHTKLWEIRLFWMC